MHKCKCTKNPSQDWESALRSILCLVMMLVCVAELQPAWDSPCLLRLLILRKSVPWHSRFSLCWRMSSRSSGFRRSFSSLTDSTTQKTSKEHIFTPQRYTTALLTYPYFCGGKRPYKNAVRLTVNLLRWVWKCLHQLIQNPKRKMNFDLSIALKGPNLFLFSDKYWPSHAGVETEKGRERVTQTLERRCKHRVQRQRHTNTWAQV